MILHGLNHFIRLVNYKLKLLLTIQCVRKIPASARSSLPAFENMAQGGILQEVCPQQLLSAFPVFLVPRPDGTVRLIYDCHEWTTHYSSPPVYLLRVTGLVNQVSPSTYFAKIVLRHGFYHLKLASYSSVLWH